MNIQLIGASLSPFPRRKNMATEICLTISLGHGTEAFISNADKTGKGYRVHYGIRTFTLYTGKRTWTKEHFFGLNTWKFTERMSWYLVDGYVFLTGKSYIVLIFLDKSRHFDTIMGQKLYSEAYFLILSLSHFLMSKSRANARVSHVLAPRVAFAYSLENIQKGSLRCSRPTHSSIYRRFRASATQATRRVIFRVFT